MARSFVFAIVSICILSANRLYASQDTIGANGIASAGLGLTGSGIAIGQVEPGRPGQMGVDAVAMLHPTVNPTDVFRQDSMPNTADTDDHAEQVAGVMISTDMTATGVAISASLYASADNGAGPEFDPESAISAQHIATLNGGDVRAINLSFANPLVGSHVNDGNQLITQFVDWSASEHDVLYVVAGNKAGETNSVPTDNFNGITVAASDRIGGIGSYRRVWSNNRYNADAEGDRTSIDLIAPGVDVRSTLLNNMLTPAVPQMPNDPIDDGTSFAAPHVTGTVALLQEHAEDQIATVGAPHWGPNARRHEVMKAVLMNSADKLIDDGTVVLPGQANPVPQGALLGMERTVLKQDGMSTWLDSFAYDESAAGVGQFTPLDEEMGTGHLNASRALTQFQTGEFDSDGTDVPVIGWDYGTTTGEDDINRYRFDQALEAGSFISITLAWDRNVEFDVDMGTTGEYDIGDTFEEYPDEFPNPDADSVINDLDLFLLPRGAASITQFVAASATTVGTLEHMFFQIPDTGEYEIWVQQFDEEAFSASQDYAIAWWAIAAPTPVTMGDFDGSGLVDASDYNTWVANFGTAVTPGTGADGNGNGVIDAADYTVWRDHLGLMIASGSGIQSAVPEPSAGWLLFCSLVFFRQFNRGANQGSLWCVE